MSGCILGGQQGTNNVNNDNCLWGKIHNLKDILITNADGLTCFLLVNGTQEAERANEDVTRTTGGVNTERNVRNANDTSGATLTERRTMTSTTSTHLTSRLGVRAAKSRDTPPALLEEPTRAPAKCEWTSI